MWKSSHLFTPSFSFLLAKTLEGDLEVRIEEAESEINTFTSNQDFLETVQSFRNLQKKHDSLTSRAKQVAATHEDVIFKRFITLNISGFRVNFDDFLVSLRT